MVLTIKILWDLEMFGAHNKDTWGAKNVYYSQKSTWGARNAWYSQKILGELEMFGTHKKNTWGARNVWYSQSNPSGFGSGIDWEEPPSRKGILVLPLISCKINHDFDYDYHKLGYGIDNRIY